jgi:hypothetical protein
VIDRTIRLTSWHFPERDIDWTAIRAGIRKSDAYLRTLKLGISSPWLHEDVGAYFADDVVPKTLHTEVGIFGHVTDVQAVSEFSYLIRGRGLFCIHTGRGVREAAGET